MKFMAMYVSSAAFIRGSDMHTIILLFYSVCSALPQRGVLSSSLAVYPLEKQKS